MSDTNRPLRVYLAHASTDKPAVRRLYQRLKSDGINVWLDEENLLPGQDWNYEILKAVQNSDVVIVCLSRNSVNKEGYIQKEVRLVLDVLDEKPEGTIFLIPARLEECEVPRRLRNYQWVDLFLPDSYTKLRRALQVRSERVGASISRKPRESESIYKSEKSYPKKPAKAGTRTIKTEVIVAVIGMIATILAGLLTSPLIEKLFIPNVTVTLSPTMQLTSTYTPSPKFTQTPTYNLSQTIEPSLTNTPLPTFTSIPLLTPKPTNTPSPVVVVPRATAIFLLVLVLLPLGSLGIIYSIRYVRTRLSERSGKEVFVPLRMPYVAGNPIDPKLNPHMFFGRDNIVQMVYKEIKDPAQKPSLLLYGRRRMGKSSALLNLGRLMRDFSIVDIYISGQEIETRKDSKLVFRLIQEVISKLKGSLFVEKLLADEEKYLHEENYRHEPVLMLSNFFTDVNKILDENNLYCLFMLDEYERIGETISNDFFMQIRETMQHKPRFVFLFAGVHMPDELHNTKWTEVFMNVKVLPISFLARDDGFRLLTVPMVGVTYKKDALVDLVLDMTGCQPLLLQAMGSEIIHQLNIFETRRVDKKIIYLAKKHVLVSCDSIYFAPIWNAECDSQNDKELLIKIAKHGGKINVISVSDKAALQKLIKREVLKIDGNWFKYVRFTVPLVKDWLELKNLL